EMDRAGAAIGRVAADMSAGEPKLVSQSMHEQQARLNVELMLYAVDVESHRYGCAHSSPSKFSRIATAVEHRRSGGPSRRSGPSRDLTPHALPCEGIRSSD